MPFLLFSDTSPCSVQCVEMRAWREIQRLAGQKRVVTQSISPSALISMSTVKAPPMSRSEGGCERRGTATVIQGRLFSCAVKPLLKIDLYTGQKAGFISSVCSEGGGGVVVLCSDVMSAELWVCHVHIHRELSGRFHSSSADWRSFL